MYHAVFVRQEGVILRTGSDAREEGNASRFLPGAVEALAQLAGSGLNVVVMVLPPHASSCAAEGHMPAESCGRTAEAVGADQNCIGYVHWQAGSTVQRVTGRGTGVELIWPGARAPGIDLSMSYFVGDTVADMRVGRLLGCRIRYLVLTGRGRRELARCWLHGERGFRVAFDLKAAAGDILLLERTPVVQPEPATMREFAAR